MKWYYAENNERKGPIDDETFNAYVQNNTIRVNTLVWNKTLTDWTPLGRLNKSGTSLTPPAEKSTQTDPSSVAFCTECGNRFSKDELATFNKSLVCAKCKPSFLQRIREGVYTPGEMNYAGFWIRFGSKIIDYVILGVINFIILFASGFFLDTLRTDPSAMNESEMFKYFVLPQIILVVIQWAIGIFYATWFVGKYAATPGKMALGLKIVTATKGKVTYLRAFGRFFAEFISGIILLIGYIMAGFDKEKRALHDRICSTRVIKK